MEASTVTARPQPKLHSLVHFEIPASDPATVSKFYEQLFNWKFSKWGEQEYWLIAHKDAPANESMGGLFKRNAPNEQFLNYFSVNSIDESAAKATSLGAQVVTAKQEIPKVGYFEVLKDPDGNTFALFQTTVLIYHTRPILHQLPPFFSLEQKTARITQFFKNTDEI